MNINITSSFILCAFLLTSCQSPLNNSVTSVEKHGYLTQKILGTWEYQSGNDLNATTTTAYREDGTYTMIVVVHKYPTERSESIGKWKIEDSNLWNKGEIYNLWNKDEKTESGDITHGWVSRKIVHLSQTELRTQFADGVTVTELKVNKISPTTSSTLR